MRKIISKCFGLVADIKFPNFMQNFINQKYINFFKIDMSEFDDFKNYKSLNALFTRELKIPRNLSKSEFISPSDGVVFECGKSSEFKAFSIKDRIYDLNELLDCKLENEQNYLNIYLSPKDYHHYHSPCDLEILSAKYIPAKLYSVAKKPLLKIQNLYAKNERVILKTKLKNDKILWIVFVGALNVGKMKFDFDENIQKNCTKITTYNYQNLNFKKGDHLGNFELGSTIVLLSDGVKFNTSSNKTLKFGDDLGEILI
ncbi:phosphatidylserine decarboxylase [Campylobacter sp. FMV-PI01]|uniref:phosphatidylserine decarboxylase n=1 Tax=Campylobacter portucalensis TaxID=2608384 RepID=A0A6L5WGS7_9BACT|nr:phosphatidylserine decarboxylase [Campylobacter portucalensis]MSN96026.1 phosphatidylserine decarboxylase [Campylobacter portucalensis]